MSDGISIGGPGGLPKGEPKIQEGLSNLGIPNQGDVSKLQEGLGGAGAQAPGGVGSTEGPSGPFDFQTNRIRDSNITQQKPGLAQALGKELGKIISVGPNKEKALMDKLKSKEVMGPKEVFETQMVMHEIFMATEFTGKIAKSVKETVQTIVKNQ